MTCGCVQHLRRDLWCKEGMHAEIDRLRALTAPKNEIPAVKDWPPREFCGICGPGNPCRHVEDEDLFDESMRDA